MQRFLLFLASIFGPILINMLGLTWRVKYEGDPEVYPQRYKTSKKIYCFWHNRILGLAFTQKKRNVGILISSHFDGEIIARIVKRMGYYPLRGSSTRGGATGLLSMLKNEAVRHLAITADGPRGPKGEVKPGVVYLASKSQLPVIPVSFDASNKWVLSSWDNFQIPKPFSKVVVRMGKPINIDKVSDDTQTKEHARRLADAINGLTN